MTYFEKIEAYFNGEMNEMEQSIFEQTLKENSVLQQEYETYKTAQSLFNFTATTLTEAEITTSGATQTVDEIITFTAQHLSEKEILGSTKTISTQPQAVVKNISTRRNRTEWLVAASMLFVISLIGSQFYQNPAIETLPQSTNAVVEKSINSKKQTPTEQKEVLPTLIITEPVAPIVKIETKKGPKVKYEPAKVRITPKSKPVVEPNHIAAVDKVPIKESTPMGTQPIAVLTTAEKIVTGKVIDKGETVVYEVENTITLKNGFHVKPGASFVATTNKTTVDLKKSEIIDNQQSIEYNATNSITLNPGFHAKAGSAFVATTNHSSATDFISTNAVISEKEEVVIKADQGITLKPGFHAKVGADFLAKVK